MNAHAVNPERIKEARLSANMSRSDLAYEIRRLTKESIRATERSVTRWENRVNAPSDGVVPAIAAATGKPIQFFYAVSETEGDDDDEEAARMSSQRGFLEELHAQLGAALGKNTEAAA